MSKLTGVTAAVRRGAAWLLPAGRRDWAEAVWAEAYEVPPGLARLAWRAGGVWVLRREALLPRRLGRAALFAAAAVLAAWAAWPRRSQVTRGTLAFGAGSGLLFGVVLYVMAPLGLEKYATDPWLPGSQADPLVVLSWVLLFAVPAVAGVLASRRCRRPDGLVTFYELRIIPLYRVPSACPAYADGRRHPTRYARLQQGGITLGQVQAFPCGGPGPVRRDVPRPPAARGRWAGSAPPRCAASRSCSRARITSTRPRAGSA